ncbi:hypothetical protein CspeluHIS016_0102220 [Cutaneotrichosporon spelunceum]|uniref:WLM-domain-containing protein n=1 Tax=Cutaneotrichosporon spelunceum TaxID=1672016 RepID=A0AAD3TMD5_9TREE|nr:hypothetical protein CspeluHIS016_0102220 [Cutaneotrichosporon spelunceum]
MSLIGKFAHLPGRPKASEAMPMLEKIASLVKPIMKKRGWKVGVLGEFFPANPALLGININHGQRINLRLRPPNNSAVFYDLEQLVLVMLHELTHIAHGPHDTSFYKLLAELEEEYYDLKRKGYSGEGFHSDGNRLQGTRLNEYQGRQRGLAAAEKRLQQQRVMGRGGVLGGSEVGGKSMREIVAEAAERRLKDDKTCKVDTKEAEEEARKAQEESVVMDATDMTVLDETVHAEAASSRKRSLSEAGTEDAPIVIDDDPVDVSQPPSPRTTLTVGGSSTESASSSRTVSAASTPPTSRPPSVPTDPKPSAPVVTKPVFSGGRGGRPTASNAVFVSRTKAPGKTLTTWTCGTCTLINPISARRCDACESPRPVQNTDDAWFCEFCGAGPREMGFWSCLECGWVRKSG